jgi:preprotein translocase subunit SecE
MELKIYKRGQGYYTRLYTALIAFALAAVGCYSLYQQLKVTGNVWVYGLVPFAVCAIFATLIYLVVNKPNIADFMISAEGEIKKVSWSSRKEIIASTMVVIFVVAGMAIMLYLADAFFVFMFDVVLKIYG